MRHRTNGLICGALTALGCVCAVFERAFYSGEWYYCVPIAALVAWGLVAFHDLDQENDRRGKLLRKHSIDEWEI